MPKEPSPQQFEIEMVTLEELVPQDHLLRKIDKFISFDFIRDKVHHCYCQGNGRPAIDPVLFIGYLFGIRSERRLVQDTPLNLAYRWFLRMRGPLIPEITEAGLTGYVQWWSGGYPAFQGRSGLTPLRVRTIPITCFGIYEADDPQHS